MYQYIYPEIWFMNEHLEALIISVLESGFCEASVCSSLRRGRACPLYLFSIKVARWIFRL